MPEQKDLAGKIEWQIIRLSGTGSLATRAFARLERDGMITSVLAGLFLRRELDRVLWGDRSHVSVRQVQEYFAQYLYLPRLTYQELVTEAVRDGVASLTWESDTFAYAGDFDEASGRYLGLQAGRNGVAVMTDGRSVIVKPAAARAQLDQERAVTPASTTISSITGGFGGPSTTISSPGTESTTISPASKPKLTRFHGSIVIEPTKLATEANKVAAEVLQHLISKLGSEVEVVIDIQAHLPDGADDQTLRVVTENCRTLRFDPTSGFEP